MVGRAGIFHQTVQISLSSYFLRFLTHQIPQVVDITVWGRDEYMGSGKISKYSIQVKK